MWKTKRLFTTYPQPLLLRVVIPEEENAVVEVLI